MPSNFGGLSKLDMSKKLSCFEVRHAEDLILIEQLKTVNAGLLAERVAMKAAFPRLKGPSTMDVNQYIEDCRGFKLKWLETKQP
jgi:hypothetical protein